MPQSDLHRLLPRKSPQVQMDKSRTRVIFSHADSSSSDSDVEVLPIRPAAMKSASSPPAAHSRPPSSSTSLSVGSGTPYDRHIPKRDPVSGKRLWPKLGGYSPASALQKASGSGIVSLTESPQSSLGVASGSSCSRAHRVASSAEDGTGVVLSKLKTEIHTEIGRIKGTMGLRSALPFSMPPWKGGLKRSSPDASLVRKGLGLDKDDDSSDEERELEAQVQEKTRPKETRLEGLARFGGQREAVKMDEREKERDALVWKQKENLDMSNQKERWMMWRERDVEERRRGEEVARDMQSEVARVGRKHAIMRKALESGAALVDREVLVASRTKGNPEFVTQSAESYGREALEPLSLLEAFVEAREEVERVRESNRMQEYEALEHPLKVRRGRELHAAEAAEELYPSNAPLSKYISNDDELIASEKERVELGKGKVDLDKDKDALAAQVVDLGGKLDTAHAGGSEASRQVQALEAERCTLREEMTKLLGENVIMRDLEGGMHVSRVQAEEARDVAESVSRELCVELDGETVRANISAHELKAMPRVSEGGLFSAKTTEDASLDTSCEDVILSLEQRVSNGNEVRAQTEAQLANTRRELESERASVQELRSVCVQLGVQLKDAQREVNEERGRDANRVREKELIDKQLAACVLELDETRSKTRASEELLWQIVGLQRDMEDKRFEEGTLSKEVDAYRERLGGEMAGLRRKLAQAWGAGDDGRERQMQAVLDELHAVKSLLASAESARLVEAKGGEASRLWEKVRGLREENALLKMEIMDTKSKIAASSEIEDAKRSWAEERGGLESQIAELREQLSAVSVHATRRENRLEVGLVPNELLYVSAGCVVSMVGAAFHCIAPNGVNIIFSGILLPFFCMPLAFTLLFLHCIVGAAVLLSEARNVGEKESEYVIKRVVKLMAEAGGSQGVAAKEAQAGCGGGGKEGEEEVDGLKTNFSPVAMGVQAMAIAMLMVGQAFLLMVTERDGVRWVHVVVMHMLTLLIQFSGSCLRKATWFLSCGMSCIAVLITCLMVQCAAHMIASEDIEGGPVCVALRAAQLRPFRAALLGYHWTHTRERFRKMSSKLGCDSDEASGLVDAAVLLSCVFDFVLSFLFGFKVSVVAVMHLLLFMMYVCSFGSAPDKIQQRAARAVKRCVETLRSNSSAALIGVIEIVSRTEAGKWLARAACKHHHWRVHLNWTDSDRTKSEGWRGAGGKIGGLRREDWMLVVGGFLMGGAVSFLA